MRCYQNKMYNTLLLCCGRCGVWMCPNALHMSGNSTDPSYLNIARVDVFRARPMCGDVVVWLYMSIAAVKIPVKPNKQRWIYYCGTSKFGVEEACHWFKCYCQQRDFFMYSIMMHRYMEKKLLLLKLTLWDRDLLYVKASVAAKCYNCLFVSVQLDGSVSLLFPGSVCGGMIHVDSAADCAGDHPK